VESIALKEKAFYEILRKQNRAKGNVKLLQKL
jgi:hypothetical protein